MEHGSLEFNCKDNNCKFEQHMGRCVFAFVKVSISLKMNANVKVSLKEFGITAETIDQFKAMFVKFRDNGERMIIHPAVTSGRDGETFVNIF